MQQSIESIQHRQLELQEKELVLRQQSQEMDYQLKLRAQDAELELRRLALERADANEKAASARLASADIARTDFARRGQTFAMWLAGGITVPLLVAGLICIFLAVAGVGNATVELTAGGILLAGSLFAGIANLIRSFLPRD